MIKTKVERKMYSTELAFGAAAVAYRVHGAIYNKEESRKTVAAVLAGEMPVSEADQAMAANMITHFQGLTLKLLSGKILNEFTQKALMIVSKEQVEDFNIGVVTYLPHMYQRDLKEMSVDDRIYDCKAEYIGPVGEKVSLFGEVVKSVYSQKWNTRYVTVITSDNHCVFFSCKTELKVGSKINFAGKVKKQADKFTTQLNFVKII